MMGSLDAASGGGILGETVSGATGRRRPRVDGLFHAQEGRSQTPQELLHLVAADDK